MGATEGLSAILPRNRMDHDQHHSTQNPGKLDGPCHDTVKIHDPGNYAGYQKHKWIHSPYTFSAVFVNAPTHRGRGPEVPAEP
jgi:hypothetical protein